MKVVYSHDKNFIAGDEYDNADFIQWMYDKSVPAGIVVTIYGISVITMSSGNFYIVSRGTHTDAVGFCMRYTHTGIRLGNQHTRTVVLRYIKDFSDKHRRPPTNKEMSLGLYITRPGISWHTKQLMDRAMIDKAFGITEIGEEVLERIDADSQDTN